MHYALMSMLSVVVVSAFESVGAILVIAHAHFARAPRRSFRDGCQSSYAQRWTRHPQFIAWNPSRGLAAMLVAAASGNGNRSLHPLVVLCAA